jgi:2-phosphosulfolactate phosphatase
VGSLEPAGRAGHDDGGLGNVWAAAIELNHKIHVLTKKEELDTVRVAGKIVIVLDVLFATTTMVAALAHGAPEVVPVLDESAARSHGKTCPENSYVLSGELNADTLPGFVQPTPLALLAHGVAGRTLIYSTTNGTVCMSRAAGAAQVYCGALLNARRLAQHIVEAHPRETVLIVCAGSANNFNLEDFCGAGAFVARFAELLGGTADLSDAARAALGVYREALLPEALFDCRVGRMMLARGLRHEVEFACQVDAFPVVPRLEQGVLRLLSKPRLVSDRARNRES